MQIQGFVVKKKIIFLIFSFFLAINILSNGGHFDANDGIETFLVTESMVLKHTAKLDPTVPSINTLHFDIHSTMNALQSLQTGKSLGPHDPMEPRYSNRPLLLSLIVIPIYLIANLTNASPIALVALLFNSTVLALTSVIVFCFSAELLKSRKIGFITSLIFSISSFAWPYNTSFFPQPIEGLFWISAVFYIHKSSLSKKNAHVCLGAFFIGLSLFVQPTSLIVMPGFLAYSILGLKDHKKIILFISIACTLLLSAGYLNYLRFGSPFDFGYGQYQTIAVHHGWIGLLGLIFSPGAGILFFFPVCILLPFAIRKMYQKDKRLCLLFSYVLIITWLYVGTSSFGEPYAWSGAGGWGPRYLVPITPFISIALAYLFTSITKPIKIIMTFLTAVGFVVNLAGILVWYAYGYSYGWVIEHLWKSKNSLNDMTWIPQYSPIILHFKSLISNYVGTIDISYYPTGYMRVGLYSCPIDSYIYCKEGLIPIIIGIIIICILFFYIWKNIHGESFSKYSHFLKGTND